jgi:hypothetical protein
MKKPAILLAIVLIALSFMSVGATREDSPASIAYRDFKLRQRGMERTLSQWKSGFGQACPYFPKPPTKPTEGTKPKDPTDPEDSILPDPSFTCKIDQTMQKGHCVCKNPDQIVNELGNCVSPKLPLSDPCEDNKKCEVCVESNGKEICKKCSDTEPNCQLCLNVNGTAVKCITCQGRNCCTEKLLDPNTLKCDTFPPEEEPDNVGPKPEPNHRPILTEETPEKVCYESEDPLSDLDDSVHADSEAPEVTPMICKTCSGASCQVSVCVGNRCKSCTKAACHHPFESFPLKNPCVDGKNCEICKTDLEETRPARNARRSLTPVMLSVRCASMADVQNAQMVFARHAPNNLDAKSSHLPPEDHRFRTHANQATASTAFRRRS